MAQGQSSALDFRFNPFQPQAAQAPPQSQEIPAPEMEDISKSPLAIREGATQDVYNKYGELKAFAASMAKKGIDVTEPDYSQPGGGLPYQTYQKLYAQTQFAKDKLIVQQRAQEQFLPLMYQNKVGLAPGQTMGTADLTDPSQIISYEPTYATETANRRLAQETDTQGASRAVNQAVYNPALAAIDQKVATGEWTEAQAANEKSKIFANTANPPVFQPRAERRDEGQTQGALELLKAVTNQTAGNWPKGTYQQRVVGGKRFDVSSRFSGEKLGDTQVFKIDSNGNEVPVTVPMIVKDWIRDPTTGDSFIRFTDEDIPDKKVDPNSGEEITTSIIASNPKYGGSAAVPELFNKAKELGFLDQTNRVIPETQVTNPELGRVNPQRTNVDVALEETRKTIKRQLLKAGEKIQQFKVPGGMVSFDRDEDGNLYLYNWKQLGYNKSNRPQNLTDEEAEAILDEQGFFAKNKKALQEGKVFPVGQQPVSPEKQKAIDLINKYRK